MSFSEKSRKYFTASMGGAGVAFLASVVSAWLGGVLEQVFQTTLVSWEMASLGIVFLSTLGGLACGGLGAFFTKWFYALVSGLVINGVIFGLVMVQGTTPLFVKIWAFGAGSLAGGAAGVVACLWFHRQAAAGIPGGKKAMFFKLAISLPMFLLTGFCLFGLLATRERPGSVFLQIFYVLMALAAFVVGILPYWKKKPAA
ncbi:MAG: hypothetical protein EXR99_09695 [Gemmataceae bacterium]|nr:hypothetical protein [Gemmataceae bacterium]